MKKISLLLMAMLLTACSSTPQRTAKNPDGLTNEELLKVQGDRIAKLERDIERKENDLRYQHLKEIQSLRIQQKLSPTVNTQCKFLCF
jgi:starvation-inducible outer membrane lipoprotein